MGEKCTVGGKAVAFLPRAVRTLSNSTPRGSASQPLSVQRTLCCPRTSSDLPVCVTTKLNTDALSCSPGIMKNDGQGIQDQRSGNEQNKNRQKPENKTCMSMETEKDIFFLVVWDGDDVTPGQIAGT